MRSADINIAVEVEPNIGFIYADRYRVQTALFNLIQNAVEALTDGGNMIISTYTAPDRRYCAIKVRDTGAGMSPELLARVGEPFFSTHTDEGLRGLGLAIVQDIVKSHGGRFEMTSTPKEGTTVILYFQMAET
jgi:signal transduction histidine kinase